MYQTYLRKANPDIQLRMQLFVNVQTKSKGGHMFRIVVSGIGNVYVLDTLDLGRVFFGLGVDWVEVATTYFQKVCKLGESSRSESTYIANSSLSNTGTLPSHLTNTWPK